MDRRLRWERYSWKIRWIALAFIGLWGLTGAQVSSETSTFGLGVLLLFAAAFNTILLLLLRRDYRPALSLPFILADLTIVTLAVSVTGGLQSPLYFLYIVPLFSASLVFGVVGCGAVTVLAVLMYSAACAGPRIETAAAQYLFLFRAFLLTFAAFIMMHLARESEAQDTDMRSLAWVARTLESVLESDHSLGDLVATAREILGCDMVLLATADDANRWTWAAVSSAPRCEGPQPGSSFEAAALIACMTEAEDVSVWNEAARDASFAAPELGALQISLRHVMAAPLQRDTSVRGMLVAVNPGDGRPFTDTHVRMLELLGALGTLILSTGLLRGWLGREQEVLTTVLKSLHSGVITVGSNGMPLAFNAIAEKLLRTDLVTDRPLSEQIHCAEIREAVVAGLAAERRCDHEIELSDVDEMVVNVTCTPIRLTASRPFEHVVVVTDITEQRRLERMKNQFVAAVSHELRTPLTSIKAFTATLLRGAEFDPETQREFLTIINTQCDRLASLINDLLTISQLDAGRGLKMEWGDVNLPALAVKVAEAQKKLTTRHEVIVEGDDGLPTVEADAQKLEQVLENLMNNAIKYSPEGGQVRIHLQRAGDQVHAAISDQGIGIPKDRQRYIFDKFYQVDGGTTRRVGGSGLGLYLVKQLVQSHHGRIWVDSEPGTGSTFHFEIPLRQSDAEDSPVVENSAITP